MKKLFLLFAVAGFVLTSCGSNAQKEEAVVEQTETTEVGTTVATDSTQANSDSTNVVDAVQE